jgi:hypothetical protein
MTIAALRAMMRVSPVYRSFFHFTDTRNLASIRNHGLLSLAELTGQKVVIPAPGGNDWSHDEDRRIGMDRYVHLCFFADHPMEFRARNEEHIKETVFLRISHKVLDLPDVLISTGVANKRGVERLPPNEAISRLDLPVIYTRTDWKDKDIQARLKIAKKYEILVPNTVTIELIQDFKDG